MVSLIQSIDRALAAGLRWLVIVALAAVLVLISLGAVVRIVPLFSMSGYDEIIELLVAWMTFAGTVALWREGTLFRIELASLVDSRALDVTLNVTAHVLMLVFAVVFTWKGFQFTAGSI